MNKLFQGRLGIQQRVLPVYRAVFFDALASACQDGLGVFAGSPRADEAIAVTMKLEKAIYFPARNLQPLNPSSPLFFCRQAGLINWLEEWEPDVLVVEANPRYLSTPQAVRWMHRRGRPVIGWGLGVPRSGRSGFLNDLLSRDRARFLHGLDGIIAYSQRGAEEYIQQGIPPERVVVAPNAAVPRPGQPPAPRLAAVDGPLRVLFIGRLQARKRIDLLLQACAALPPHLQPSLWIVGDGPAAVEIKEMAQRVYPRAEFFGARHGDELEPFFAADLFVLPGTGGLAVQQAMAHGLPVIVAQGDGTQEDLVRPGNGWLVPPGDLAALTHTLQEAVSDISRLRALGWESYRIVEGEANLEKMVGVFVEIAGRLISRKERKP
jgi:glycosyltransferase involved in cell wall biosynthesis